MTKYEMTLADLGEREIISRFFTNISGDYAHIALGIGDDAAVVNLPKNQSNQIVITTDSAPTPVIWSLGWYDYYYLGWYSIMVNVSDLAAMGAFPLGIVVAVECSQDTKVSDFERFVSGALDACKIFACPLLGGNLREGDGFQAVGTAIGFTREGSFVKRNTARPNDIIVLIGDMGLFWASYAATANKIALEKEQEAICKRSLCTPTAKIREGYELASKNLINSCIDVSDGLSIALYDIAQNRSVDLNINLDQINLDPFVVEVGNYLQVDPMNLIFGFGDWQLLCTIPQSQFLEAEKILKAIKTKYNILGHVRDGKSQVFCTYQEKTGPLNILPHERFAKTSAYISGVDGYFKLLKKFKIIKELIFK